ncbi:MAG: MFS transporter [Desulfobacterales bacterium CG07_land_8_20_14_0_80_52_14]|nr:MAG: MFS transporter [Desulfobacterales bacterium CG07_land_8_20_14_0_80_52_14]
MHRKNSINVTQDEPSERFSARIGFLFLLTSIFFINFMARIVLSPLLPDVEADLDIRHSQAGSLFLIISSGYFVSLLGSSFFSARFSHRQTVLVSGSAVGLALIGISINLGFDGTRIALFFIGLGAGLYLPSAIVMITSTFHSRHWGKAIAIHELAPNIGFVAAPFISEAVMRYFSWRGVFFILGLTSLMQVGLFLKFGRGGDFSGNPPSFSSLKTILSNPSFWLMVLLFGLGISGTMGLFAMLPVFLVSSHGFERSAANLLVSMSRIAGAVVVFWGGWLTDRLGPKRVMVMVFILSGATTMLIGLAPWHYMVLLIFLQPVIAVCFFPAGFAVLSQNSPPDLRNVVISVTIPIAILTGGGIIPTLIGTLGEVASFEIAFVVVGLFIASGGFFSTCISKSDNPLTR